MSSQRSTLATRTAESIIKNSADCDIHEEINHILNISIQNNNLLRLNKSNPPNALLKIVVEQIKKRLLLENDQTRFIQFKRSFTRCYVRK